MNGHYFRDAARALHRSRTYSIVAVLTLAVGIGANTAVFSVANALLLQPEHVSASDKLVNIYRIFSARTGTPSLAVSYPDYLDLAEQRDVFDGVLAYAPTRVAVTVDHQPARVVLGESISTNYFDVLGIRMTIGRGFGGVDTHATLAVISHSMWIRDFHRENSALGRTVRIRDQLFTIVGVAPEQYRGLNAGPLLATDVWIPLNASNLSGRPDSANMADRDRHWLLIKARLRSDVTFELAQVRLRSLAASLEQAYPSLQRDPQRNAARRFDATLLDDIWIHESFDAFAVPAAAALMATTVLVLLIVLANLSNLMLARTAIRTQEMAVRFALGARRTQIVRLWLAESTLLGAAGGLVSLLVLRMVHEVLSQFTLDIRGIPAAVHSEVDWKVMTFTVGLSLVTGVALGILPAIRASTGNRYRWLAESRIVDATGGRHVARHSLILVQVACGVCLVLLAARFVQTYVAFRLIEPGFEYRTSAVVGIDLQLHGFPDERIRPFLSSISSALHEIRHSAITGLTDHLPFDGGAGSIAVRTTKNDSHATESIQPGRASYFNYARIGPGYFSVMGIPVLSGRDFGLEDDLTADHVLIVSKAAAENLWAGVNPVGQVVSVAGVDVPPQHMIVVGVVGDTRPSRAVNIVRPFFYRPLEQDPSQRIRIVARGSTSPAKLVEDLRDLVRRKWPELAIVEDRTMESYVADESWPLRMAATVFASLGAVGLMVAMAGFFGLIAYVTEQRRFEIAIRMAMGANRGPAIWPVVRPTVLAASIGAVLGAATAVVVGQIASSRLFGLSEFEPLTMLAAVIVSLTVASLACLIPAGRAARIEPMDLLRRP